MQEYDAVNYKNKNILTRRDWLAFRYLLNFLLWASLFAVLLTSGLGDYLQHSIAETEAKLVTSILNLTGIGAIRTGQIVSLNSAPVSVSVDEPCTSGFLSLALVAAILALPTGMRRKLSVAMAVFIILQSANTLRITHLILILREHPEIFDFVHLIIWQILMLGLAIGLLAGALAVLYKTTPWGDEDRQSTAANTTRPKQYPDILKYATALAVWGLLMGVAHAFGGGGGGGGGGGPAPTSVPVATWHPLSTLMIFWIVAVHRLWRSR